MENLRTVAQRLAKVRRADGQDHEFLDVQAIVGVRTAIDDVHHRHRHDRFAALADIFEKRQLLGIRSRMGRGQGNRQQRVGAEAALGLGAIQVDHDLIEAFLITGIVAQQRLPQYGIDVLDGLQHALAAIALRIPVTQLHRFARTGGSPRGHRSTTLRAVIQDDIRLDRGIAP